MNHKNSFKAVVNGHLDVAEKKQLFQRTKMYILWQELQELLKDELNTDEEIRYALPITNESNSAVMNSGLLGMTYARSPRAREYVDTFLDLRGNRLLLFTQERIIFLVVVEYLEEGLYYSYPYTSIDQITLQYQKISPFTISTADPRVMDIAKAGGDGYYYLDFESQGDIFVEMFYQKDAQRLLEIFDETPALKGKVSSGKIHRRHKRDYVLGNPMFGVRYMQVFNWLVFSVLGIFLIIYLLGFFRIGPLKDMLP
ncbi:hypothetical protein [Enterococcus nangangensis]|uniref:hypothetical protein n=1 Tax=Enterococcus nangangensis TaxID=2559926 RepID=UPI0010F8A95A|nr:hypothetical protein [Enterococcus nangangensis]